MVSDWPSEDAISTLELMELSDHLSNLARDQNWGELSYEYATVDIKKLTTVEIISYLRTLFTARDKIATWVDFRERARAEFVRRGRDATRLMSGLG